MQIIFGNSITYRSKSDVNSLLEFFHQDLFPIKPRYLNNANIAYTLIFICKFKDNS